MTPIRARRSPNSEVRAATSAVASREAAADAPGSVLIRRVRAVDQQRRLRLLSSLSKALPLSEGLPGQGLQVWFPLRRPAYPP